MALELVLFTLTLGVHVVQSLMIKELNLEQIVGL